MSLRDEGNCVAMDFYGRSLMALLIWLASFALVTLAYRRWPNAAARGIGLWLGSALIAVCFAMSTYAS